MTRGIPKERSEVYFFSHDKEFVPHYDAVEELLNPHIKATHDMMIDLVVESVRTGNRRAAGRDPTILVIGSGTGGEVLRLVRRLPRAGIVAIDFSPAMNVQLRQKFAAEFPERQFDSHITLLEQDFLSEWCTPGSLTKLLREKCGTEKFDAVIIGFVTHHYSDKQKLEFYVRVKAILHKGGSLIHGDLFDYSSKWLSKLAHAVGESWIRQLTNPELDLRPRLAKIQHIAKRLCKAWIRHWNNTHIYSPVRDCFDSSPRGIFPDHVSVLRRLGFSEVECPLRMWEVGVIWARL